MCDALMYSCARFIYNYLFKNNDKLLVEEKNCFRFIKSGLP